MHFGHRRDLQCNNVKLFFVQFILANLEVIRGNALIHQLLVHEVTNTDAQRVERVGQKFGFLIPIFPPIPQCLDMN